MWLTTLQHFVFSPKSNDDPHCLTFLRMSQPTRWYQRAPVPHNRAAVQGGYYYDYYYDYYYYDYDYDYYYDYYYYDYYYYDYYYDCYYD